MLNFMGSDLCPRIPHSDLISGALTRDQGGFCQRVDVNDSTTGILEGCSTRLKKEAVIGQSKELLTID